VSGPDAASTETSAPAAEPNDDTARLAQQMIQAQKMDAIGQLAAGIAHELNNPLASILAVSHLVGTDRSLPPELRHQAEQLGDEARRTHRIVNGLLDFARQRPTERQPASLPEIVARVLDLQSYAFRPGQIEASVAIADDIPLISMDRARIEQVLINLTLNAAQAIRSRTERGTVRIVAVRVPADDGDGRSAGTDIVRVSITDDGPGIPEGQRARLFEPYVTTRASGAGSGLGLAVSLAIAIEHGGSLRHEPGPHGIGSTFVLELPIGAGSTRHRPDTDGTSPGAESNRPSPARSANPPLPGASDADPSTEHGPALPRILILDDEGSIRDFLARILRRNGFEPVAAVDGQSALEIVRTNPPAAILCDHRMAGMSGIAFHEAVAAINPRLARRFAFMSGDVLNPQLHDFAKAHDILVMAKPFDIEGVTRAVARLVATAD
jgi:two-component system NtrC family sensor kinase